MNYTHNPRHLFKRRISNASCRNKSDFIGKLIFLSIFVIASILPTCGQQTEDDPPQKVEITLKDGNTIVGTLLQSNDLFYKIESESLGVIDISRANVETFVVLQEEEKSKLNGYPIDYHNSTHYLANPSGFTLKKGQSYYENIGVFFNSYAVGITDNFTIAMGGEVATLLFGGQFPILYISPRFSLPLGEEKHSFSFGGTIFTSPENEFDGFGVLQAAVTFGDRNTNFTIGSGIGFGFEGGFDDQVLPFYLSFMIRVSEKISVVSDNFVVFYNDFNDTTGVLSVAARIHLKKKGAALNLGLFRPTEDLGDLLAIPFVSLTLPIKY